MEIYNNRVAHTANSTMGLLSFDNKNPWAVVVEDEPRDIKIKGETRIPAGRYKLGIRKKDTPLTIKHRNTSYYKPWFKYHIELLNVPNFTGIYIHTGNKESHTEGCQIFGDSMILENGEFTCRNSTKKVKAFYELIYPKLENGEEIYYNVINEI